MPPTEEELELFATVANSKQLRKLWKASSATWVF